MWKSSTGNCVICLTHTPAELLDCAHVDDAIVEMTHELGHVLVQKLLISVHRVSCTHTHTPWNIDWKMYKYKNKQNVKKWFSPQMIVWWAWRRVCVCVCYLREDTGLEVCAAWWRTGTRTQPAGVRSCCPAPPASTLTEHQTAAHCDAHTCTHTHPEHEIHVWSHANKDELLMYLPMMLLAPIWHAVEQLIRLLDDQIRTLK